MRRLVPGLMLFALLLCEPRASAEETQEPEALPPLPAPEPAGAPSAAPPSAPAPAPSASQSPPPPKGPPETPKRQPLFNFGVTFGIGAPTGWAGTELSASPIDRFALSAEAGLGTNGVQFASMLHVYPIDAPVITGGRARTGFGLGASTGTFVGRNITKQSGEEYFRRAWFLNAEYELLMWDYHGLNVEFFVGLAVLLNRGDGTCITNPNCGALGLDPYAGIRLRIGTWFGH